MQGASQTQINFLQQCPIVSQVTSTVQVLEGDKLKAKETQIIFLKSMGNLVDGVPVVGHAKGFFFIGGETIKSEKIIKFMKGIVHYACGDVDSGNEAMKSSSRSIG